MEQETALGKIAAVTVKQAEDLRIQARAPGKTGPKFALVMVDIDAESHENRQGTVQKWALLFT